MGVVISSPTNIPTNENSSQPIIIPKDEKENRVTPPLPRNPAPTKPTVPQKITATPQSQPNPPPKQQQQQQQQQSIPSATVLIGKNSSSNVSIPKRFVAARPNSPSATVSVTPTSPSQGIPTPLVSSTKGEPSPVVIDQQKIAEIPSYLFPNLLLLQFLLETTENNFLLQDTEQCPTNRFQLFLLSSKAPQPQEILTALPSNRIQKTIES